jgi:hypothetical protein
MAEEALIFEIDILDYEFRKKIKAFEDEMQAILEQD